MKIQEILDDIKAQNGNIFLLPEYTFVIKGADGKVYEVKKVKIDLYHETVSISIE